MFQYTPIKTKKRAAKWLLPAVILLDPLAAWGQSCTVNAVTDTGAGSGGSGGILYCVNQANSVITVEAASVTYAINFAPSLNGQTIALNSTLQLTNNFLGVTINLVGPSANLLTISGNNKAPVFSISALSVNISGLTTANGVADSNGGGAINNGGNALSTSVSNCVFVGNTASSSASGGAIFNTGNLTISNSTFS